MENSKDSFYVGYLAQAPPALARWLRPRILLLLAAMGSMALALVASMQRFSLATFEFGELREFHGTIQSDPYPALQVPRPLAQESNGSRSHSSYLLVNEFKHGAAKLVQDFEGQRVRLRGTLIYRDGQTMIEVQPGSLVESDEPAAPARATQDLGLHTLQGEIVDSKCFLGVMKPGNLKPHRACAIRCISGGIPPVLMLRDEGGLASYLLLVNAAGEALNAELLHLVALPVQVSGRVKQKGETLFLYADASAILPLP